MSKERLEDIKEEVELLRGDMCVTSIEVDTSADAILDDMAWLIERVQELEEANKKNYWIASDFKYENLVLEQKNQRYREALEFYGDKGTYEVEETLPPTDEYQQPIEPIIKTVPIIYYDKGITARQALGW